MVQVEVEFTIRHSMDELKHRFIHMGHFPDWRAEKIHGENGKNELVFFETREISVNLHKEDDRYAWFVFSIEACNELKRRIVIPNAIDSSINIDNLELGDFLKLCRQCLVGHPQPNI
jgi:Fe2+ transport system protein FeoA